MVTHADGSEKPEDCAGNDPITLNRIRVLEYRDEL